jgi:hypothetical protein
MRSGRELTVALGVLTAACSGSSRVAALDPVPSRLGSPVTVGPDPIASGASSVAAPQPSPPAPSPFHRVQRGLAAYPVVLGEALFLRSADDGLAMVRVAGNELVRDEGVMAGIAACDGAAASAFFGVWPTAAWFLNDYHPWTACEPRPTPIYRWKQSRWVYQDRRNAHLLLLEPHVSGSTLVLEVPRRIGPPWGYTLSLRDGRPGVRSPVPQRVPGHPGPDIARCYTIVEYPIALVTGSSGGVHVIGASRCSYPAETDPDAGTDGGPAAEERSSSHGVSEYWPPGARTSRILEVPLSLDSYESAVGSVDAEHVWVSGKDDADQPAVARFDGTTWSRSLVPPGKVTALAPVADGTLWISLRAGSTDGLYRIASDGTATPVPLPADSGAISGLYARAPDDVWLIAESGVYRTAAVPAEFDWQARTCSDEERERFAALRSGGCN